LATLIDDPNGRKELTNFLFQCFDALKVYGKDPEQLQNLNSVFQMVLADYTLDQVRKAFSFYLKHNSDLPAPADIVNIIERNGKPPLDKSIYIAISKKHESDRTGQECLYIKDYERFMITGRL
jgi:hypothetical protein